MKYLSMKFPGGKPKCFTVSYDDNVASDLRLIELMKKYGIAGTFNVNTSLPEGKRKIIKKEQFGSVYAPSDFIEIATHGDLHPYLNAMPTSVAVSDIMKNRAELEKITGGIIRGHALPYGTYNDDVVDILRLCGIVYSRTTVSTYKFSMPTDWLRLNPTCHHDDKRLTELLNNFLATERRDKPSMFYLWGHTYEFDDNDNWDVIEKAFRTVSGNPDIWFATNIQIYDYTRAFNSLIYSADGRTVYNPSATDVWLKTDDIDTVCVPSGKTLTF